MAGLRATNELMLKNEQMIEEKKNESLDNEAEGKEPDKARKKTQQNVLSRSDSTGSGRKFLAPTLSDPQARSSKDRFNDSKKKSVRQQQNKAAHLPHLNENPMYHHHHHAYGHHNMEQHQNLTNHHVNLAFEVHDWWSEQIIFQESSDEE